MMMIINMFHDLNIPRVNFAVGEDLELFLVTNSIKRIFVVDENVDHGFVIYCGFLKECFYCLKVVIDT